MLVSLNTGGLTNLTTVGYTIYNNDKSIYQNRTTDGVVELVDGIYVVEIEDIIAKEKLVVLDTGGSEPEYGCDYFFTDFTRIDLLALEETLTGKASQTSVDNITGYALEETSQTLYEEITGKASQTSVDNITGYALDATVAKEETLTGKASQESVNDIPTNPLLDNDIRLDYLDGSITEIPTNTEAFLSSTHGNGNWDATTAEVDIEAIISGVAARLSVEHGDGNWEGGAGGGILNPITITEDTLDIEGQVLGKITDPFRTPIAGAKVIAYAEGDTEHKIPLFITESDGDGGFSLVVEQGATYHVGAVSMGGTFSYKIVTV